MMTKLTRLQKKKRTDELCELLKLMPPTANWPDHSRPFRRDQSPLLNYISRLADCDIDTAEKERNKAALRGAIIYDDDTKLWRGDSNWAPSQRGHQNRK